MFLCKFDCLYSLYYREHVACDWLLRYGGGGVGMVVVWWCCGVVVLLWCGGVVL